MQTLNDLYKTNESNNNHIENALLVVKAFGTEKESKIIEGVIKRRGNNGYSSNLHNTIIKTALKYENERINKGDDILFVNGEII